MTREEAKQNEISDNALPAGVVDALSCYQVGGSSLPSATISNVANSGLASDSMQDWLRGVLIDNNTTAGIRVNAQTAMRYAPLHYAISKIAGHLSVMSMSLKERTGDRTTRDAREHPAHRLIKYPNDLYAGSVFTDAIVGHAVFRGNGRAWIQRDAFMNPESLVLMPPDRTRTVIVDGEKWHIAELVIDNETGQTRRYKIRDRDVLHLTGHSPDGICGYDLLLLAKQSIALGLGAEKQQANHFGRNAIPGLLLQVPQGKLTKEGEARKFLDEFRQMHEGPDNAGKTAMLRHGIEAQQLSHTGRDSQAVETRQFQREDVALWFALETILGDETNSYKSHEQRQIAYLQGLPGKLMKRYEEQRDCKLLTEQQKNSDSHFHRMNPGSLLRADMQTTIATLKSGIEATIYSPNDAREYLGIDARDGGDVYGNPNTTAGGSSEPDSELQNTQLRQRLRDAYAGRLRNLFDVEAKRITTAAAKPEKFVDWVNRFYAADSFRETFANVWVDLGGDASAAQSIMDKHRDAMIEAHELGDADQIKSAVAKLADEIPQLASELVK